MPLSTISLDDRHFQQIVDQAKRLIPQYCPEWTDHNVSDPGVALIELFAWMTDMLLYRVNQVPDKMYIRFLELIGMRLEPPHAAEAPVNFYLSAPQPGEVMIPEGTEVATVRTERSRAVVFTTEADLTIRPPVVAGAFTRNASHQDNLAWTAHDLRQLELPGQRIPIFPPQPAPLDAFYLAFQEDHSHNILALTLKCELAGGAGVVPSSPPLQWEVSQEGPPRWALCEVEKDETGGFNGDGEIILHLPAMIHRVDHGVDAYWLRCRLTDAQTAAGGYYRVSPDLLSLRVEARGGTVRARHAVTVLDEVVGHSEGTPGQVFKLLNPPILRRDPQRDHLIVQPPDGPAEQWQEVTDFGDSQPGDRHYTLDSLDGTLTMGPSLLQPDGSVYRFGAVPPKESLLTFSRYQHGGGVAGNVPQAALSVLKTAIPYVARVTNRQPAEGGRNAQSLEDARLRAPQFLRTRTRAVTADDYEYLARQVPGVARARCLTPGAQPGGVNDLKPGQVLVLVLPEVDSAEGQIAPEKLVPSAELLLAVKAFLDRYRLLGTSLEVEEPDFIWVSVEARLRLPEGSSEALAAEVRQRAEAELYRYLNPYKGGSRGTGWPFGRDLYHSEIYALLQRIPSVEFVDELKMVTHLHGNAAPRPIDARLAVAPRGLICSEQHRVTVS
jgi:predicted phage baseplate assembly protein